eukprot:1995747-Amphidinium_carterae.1
MLYMTEKKRLRTNTVQDATNFFARERNALLAVLSQFPEAPPHGASLSGRNKRFRTNNRKKRW